METLVGTKYKIYGHVVQLCANRHVCAAMVAGCRIQNDVEEQIAFGFARRFGTVYCKYRQGGQHSCRDRCAFVLQVIQQKTSELNQQAGYNAVDSADLVVRGRQF